MGSRVGLWDGMTQKNEAIVPLLLCSYSVVCLCVCVCFFFLGGGGGGLVLFIALLHC